MVTDREFHSDSSNSLRMFGCSMSLSDCLVFSGQSCTYKHLSNSLLVCWGIFETRSFRHLRYPRGFVRYPCGCKLRIFCKSARKLLSFRLVQYYCATYARSACGNLYMAMCVDVESKIFERRVEHDTAMMPIRRSLWLWRPIGCFAVGNVRFTGGSLPS